MTKAILAVSFGTTYIETREKTIHQIEEAFRKAFPEYLHRTAYTSHMVRARIEKNEGIQMDSVDTALEKLATEGVKEVYISSTHIIPGSEYHKLLQGMAKHQHRFEKIALAKPLLYQKEHYQEVASAMGQLMPILKQDEALLLMGHGSEHPANAAYLMLQHFLERTPTTSHVYLGTVEGYPELEDILKEIENKEYKKLYLMPFMVVAGDHAVNDMASEEEDSWSSKLQAEGYQVENILKGLGEFPEIREIFVRRLEEILAS